jgi:outer membrane protein OmpA-like peptidoglycan-associated protein
MIKTFAAVMCIIALQTLNANAEGEIKPQFEATQVLEHFQPVEVEPKLNCPAGSVCLPKKKSRGVCIGAKAQCEQAVKKEFKAKEGFDLLITFELGSDRLSAVAKANLEEFAKAMNTPLLRERSFNVDGHTDARGADSMNMALSEQRAQIVVRYLTELGVDEKRLHAQGFGESRPRVENDPFASANRRVEATMQTNEATLHD